MGYGPGCRMTSVVRRWQRFCQIYQSTVMMYRNNMDEVNNYYVYST